METKVNYLESRNAFADFAHIPCKLVLDCGSQSNPRVTIAIPTFRRLTLLRQAIESALNQEGKTDYEIIVVDNDTDPATNRLVDELAASYSSPKLRLYRNVENIGAFGNWNRCIEYARGEWVSILNDDDLLDPAYLKEMLAVVDQNPSISFLSCDHYTLDERPAKNDWKKRFRRLKKRVKAARRLPVLAPQIIKLNTYDYFLNNQHAGSLGILFKKKLAVDLGGFNPVQYPLADYSFNIRFQIKHGAWKLCKKLVSYRIGSNDSLNDAVLIACLTEDYEVRKQLMEAHLGHSWLLKNYSLNRVFFTLLWMQDYWRKKIDIEKVSEKLGFRPKNCPIRHYWTKRLIQMIYR